MAVPYTFATIPNGQTIPLQYLDANFAYIESQVGSIVSGVLTISGGSTGLLPNIPTPGNVILSGTLNIANGGTGATTANDALNALLPAQAGNVGKILTTDGNNVGWSSVAAGVVTSFSAGGTGLSPSIATSGAVTLTGAVNIASGGTGATSAQGATTNLLPDQTGHPGDVLATNGAGVLSWIPVGGAASLAVGTSPIANGSSGNILYNNAGILAEVSTTGTGDVVLGTSASILTPTVTKPLLVGLQEQELSASILAGAVALDCATATVFYIVLNANITSLTFSNIPASGRAFSLTLSIEADGTPRTITWPTEVKWPNNIAPTLTSTAGKTDTFVLYTYDAGTKWFAFVAGQNA